VYQDLLRAKNITFNELRLEYGLEGSYNFIAWKDHMKEVFNDNIFLDCIKRYFGKPMESYAQNLTQWKKARQGEQHWMEYGTTLSPISIGNKIPMQCGRN